MEGFLGRRSITREKREETSCMFQVRILKPLHFATVKAYSVSLILKLSRYTFSRFELHHCCSCEQYLLFLDRPHMSRSRS